jgi:hypothetical protein
MVKVEIHGDGLAFSNTILIEVMDLLVKNITEAHLVSV